MEPPLKMALLGCGGVAGRHAAAARSLAGQVELLACCSRDAARTAAFAAAHGAAPFTDFRRMLDEARPDLLVVAIPPFAHGGEVEEAARAGVHVLVEKPVALADERAEAMVAAIRTAGVVGACGFMYRFGAAVERWQAAADAGETGRAGHFSGFFHCNALHAPWWRSREKSGGQMVEQLIHLVDLARHVLGEPQTVYARAATFFHRETPGYDGDDQSAILFGYDDGRIAVLHASNGAVPGRWEKGWRVVAERMTGIFADWNHAEIVQTSGEVRSETIAGQRDVFAAQLADVIAAIREKRPPRVPLEVGAASLRLALAARRSVDAKREIRL